MKLATYRDGSRDGQLVVVSRDLGQACYANGIATRLQQVLDDWNFMAPQLESLSQSLNQGRARHAFAFDPRQCLAPLPRPAAWLAGEAWPAQGESLRQRGLAWPESLSAPLLRVGGGEALLGPHDGLDPGGAANAAAAGAATGLEPEPQLAVLADELPAGALPSQALEAVRLLLLVNDWVLRPLQQDELARGLPPLHSRPALQFAPVAVTPDELGGAWQGGRAALSLHSMRNGRKQPVREAGEGMRWSLGELLAEAVRKRPLRAGTLLGAGVPTAQVDGAAPPAWQPGDSLRLEFKLADGATVFGAIDMDLADDGQNDTPDTGDSHEPATT